MCLRLRLQIGWRSNIHLLSLSDLNLARFKAALAPASVVTKFVESSSTVMRSTARF